MVMERERSVSITINDEADTMMQMQATNINEEVDGARDKFEHGFVFSKMDRMIHRFPAGLARIGSRDPYIVPRFVAIGPYHQGETHLKKMEEVKKAAAYYLCVLMQLVPGEVMEKMAVAPEVKEARGRYVVDGGVMEGTMAAAMMFYDACFLLFYMVAYASSRGKEEEDFVNTSMRRFLFSNRDSITNDILLLENQLPWPVLQALMGAVSEGKKRFLLTVVGEFIARMGNAFKVCETLNPDKPYVWDDINNPPSHLLALLWRHKTENHTVSPSPLQRCPPLLNDCLAKIKMKIKIPAAPKTSQTDKQGVAREEKQVNKTTKATCFRPNDFIRFLLKPLTASSISSVSAMELQEIGIRLTASKTAAFSDMGFVQGRFWSEFSLAPLSLSDVKASCLVNMAAWEVCTASRFGDDPERTAVCSYLALLATFIVPEEDVHMLRAKGLLHRPHSNKEMLTFFKTAVKHLPDGGSRFAHIMKDVEDYRAKRYIWTRLYRFVYNNYEPAFKAVSILVAFFTLYRGILSIAMHY
ncbi:hypothetical protein BS78_05G022400 [Paspalum vaginatum]|nr:hypothetical protein BS78_05G022400 [Paspalum vaginatum]